MNNEQKQQAQHLYYQTDLSKTQIAHVLNISRRSLHYWVREGNWDRLKKSAKHMPSMLAENCYHIFAHLSEHLLSERRIMRPITHIEANTLHKLTLTIKNLKNRNTVNESMEMLAYFVEGVNRKAPQLAKELMPHVQDYLSSRASVYPDQFYPENFNAQGFIPEQEEDNEEAKLDLRDIVEWTDFGFKNSEEQPGSINETAAHKDLQTARPIPPLQAQENASRGEAEEKGVLSGAKESVILNEAEENVTLTQAQENTILAEVEEATKNNTPLSEEETERRAKIMAKARAMINKMNARQTDNSANPSPKQPSTHEQSKAPSSQHQLLEAA
jgi:transposase-like protein